MYEHRESYLLPVLTYVQAKLPELLWNLCNVAIIARTNVRDLKQQQDYIGTNKATNPVTTKLHQVES